MSKQGMSRRSFVSITAMTALAVALDWSKINAYAAKMGPMKDYPTVVIGAGLGGLCCGAYLAKQGVPVTVVEQHSIPGGYATAFDRGRFTFEVSLHGTSINNNATARILDNVGVLEKLQLVRLPEVYRLKAPGLDISVPQQDPEAFIALLSKHFPEEEKGIRSYVKEMIGLSEEVEQLHEKKGEFIKILFPVQYRKMWSIRNKTLADFLNDHVKSPELQGVLSSLWGYYGLPPSRLSAFYYANATGEYLRHGSFYIKERSQNLSNALAEAIEGRGGKILYNTEAEKIFLKDGSVTGVVLFERQNPACPGRGEQRKRSCHVQEHAAQRGRSPRLLEETGGFQAQHLIIPRVARVEPRVARQNQGVRNSRRLGKRPGA